MNKLKLTATVLTRAFLNAFLVIATVTLASLIGVGGAALWIYGRPLATQDARKEASTPAQAAAASGDERALPRLTPLADLDGPAQLTPARYVPSESEIATLSDTPRYTYISYDGGRQQAHLRVTTVLSTAVPAPLAPASEPAVADAVAVGDDRAPLTDSASRYIRNSQGRVIGIDGTAGVVSEARSKSVTRALPVQPAGLEPEVRVASPVVVRKAQPVDGEAVAAPQDGGFNVQSELAREDDRPALRALPVTRAPRSDRRSLLGAGDDLRSFGSN